MDISTSARSNIDMLYPYSQEDQFDDPIRLARDHWVARHTNMSDSSEIIDSIDVDMIDANDDINQSEIFLIIDTNILIHHLHVIKQVLTLIETDRVRLNVVMLVPGIVVSELDFQKNSAKSIASDSRRASSWLATEIGNTKGRVKGQAYTQTMLLSGDWRQRGGLSNDELILDCCKYFGHVKRKDVLLLTNDNNLAVQASANALDLFARGASAVIRPRPSRGSWNSEQLLDSIFPGFARSTASSIHASRPSRGNYAGEYYTNTDANATPPSTGHPEDDVVMEIDLDGHRAIHADLRQDISSYDNRDSLHKHMADKLNLHIRRLTGKAAMLQSNRRERESMYSPANARYTGQLPTESDWNHTWSLRDCLRFLARVPPPRERSWAFGDGEASSLADFLGLPGEKGARPGREWAKHDWQRELLTVQRLARDFGLDEGQHEFAEYEYAIMEAFSEP